MNARYNGAMVSRPTKEVAAAAGGSLVATLVMKAAVLGGLTTRVPKSLRDPLLQTWQLAWGVDALVHRPLQVWDANAFWPLERSLAFSDALLGYAPLGVWFGAGTRAAVVRYNAVFLLAYALAAFGAYVLARQLGASRGGAAVAGIAFAFAPWRLAQEAHLHVLSTGGVPLSLALLLRGHGMRGRGLAGPPQPRLVVLGWLVAAWQISLGFSIGLPFGYLLAGVSAGLVAWLGVRLHRDRGNGALRRLAMANLAGGAVFLATVGLFAAPYAAVLDDHPEAARTLDAVGYYSPPPSGFIIAPAASLLVGDWFDDGRDRLEVPEEMTLSPGLAVIALGAIGLLWGAWRVRVRIALAVIAVGAFILGLGMAGPGRGVVYEVLFDHLPGWAGIRTPGRLVFLLSLAAAMLAADATDVLRDAVRRRGRVGPVGASFAAGLLGVALAGAVAIEGAGATPMVRVPTPPVDMSEIADPVFFLPSDIILDNAPMFFSTDGFPAILNGNSGFVPTSLRRLRERTSTFPDRRSVDALCAVGARSVVVARAWFGADGRHLDAEVVRALRLSVERRRDAFAIELPCWTPTSGATVPR